jgi:hypothetical protein
MEKMESVVILFHRLRGKEQVKQLAAHGDLGLAVFMVRLVMDD